MFNLCTAKKPMKKKRNMFRQGVQIFYCLVCLYKTSEFRFNSRLARAGTPEQRPVRTGIIIETLRDRFMGSAEARRGGAGRKGSEVEPVKRNTSRYYRQTENRHLCLSTPIRDHRSQLRFNYQSGDSVVAAARSGLSGVWWAHNRDRYAWATTCPAVPLAAVQLSRVWRHELGKARERGGGVLLSISQLSIKCSSLAQLGLHKRWVKQIFHCQKKVFFLYRILYHNGYIPFDLKYAVFWTNKPFYHS